MADIHGSRALLAAALALGGSPAWAAQGAAAAAGYPQRPVRIIVNVTPGGGVDSVARVAAQHYNAVWGQPFVVDNRTGGGGSIGVELVARAAPDGYTLLVCSSGIVTTAAFRAQNYDPVRDLQPVTVLTSAPYILLTTSSLPVANVKDLLALARAKPNAVSFASAGNGSILHMAAELLVSLANTPMLHVPYKGVADAYPAVVSGQVNWVLGAPISALPLVKGGRLKPLAVTSAARSKLLPDLPTIAESGVPGYDVRGWFALFGPRALPKAVVGQLYAEARRGMQAPEVVKRMANEGMEVIVNPPEEFAAEVKAEYDKWRTLVKRLDIKS
jgi:tripartite-type tricarboxylate transporter receptor subunit TctC